MEVPVYIGNSSGFCSVEMLIELDSRLRFDEESELGTRTADVSGVHISHYMELENTVTAKFTSKSKTRVTENGEIGFLRVMLSEDTPAGRYDIWLSSSPDEEHMLLTHNSYDAWFGSECFSQLRGGSITVKDGSTVPQNEQSAPHHEENVQRNEAPQSGSSSDNNEKSSEPAAAVTTAATTAVTAAQTTAASKTTVTVSVSSKAAASSTSETTATATASTVTAVTTETAAENHDTKTKDKNLLIPVIAATVIALGTACFIVRKGGRSK